MRTSLSILAALALASCAPVSSPVATIPQVGEVVVADAALSRLIDPDAKGEVLATGFGWSEGPVWIADASLSGGGFLLFSDVPGNVIHRWDADGGIAEFLNPSGAPATPDLREPGTNGLIPSAKAGHILAADHGNRAVVEISLTTKQKTVVTDRFGGRLYSSPNDLVLASNGDLYFTDPPYGFAAGDASPLKEQPVNGVYHRAPDGTVTLIDGSLGRPNGIVLSPDETRLYVANSDPKHAVWMVYDRAEDGSISGGRAFYDATALVGDANPGLPDGMKTDTAGNVFATGPGGVLVFAPDGRWLGTIRVGGPVANVTFGGADGRTLFLTAHGRLIRIPTKTQGHRQVGGERRD